MKKIVLTALNAKYFHTNLAVRCLKAAAGDGHDIEICEHTINDNTDAVLEDIVSHAPDAVGFSCYIWNIEIVLRMACDLRKVLPQCFIFLGGPEVSYDCEALLTNYDYIDMIIKGEGELTFCAWLDAFENNRDFLDIDGICIETPEGICDNPFRCETYDLNSLPFLYDDLSEYENKIIYFETSRGCPMRCAYCISGIGSAMSYMDVKKAAYAFEHFIEHDVQQVKLVDRTFNHPLERAKELLNLLIDIRIKYPDSKTNFHFEVTASMVDDEFLDILKSAPEGLLQFEAGVQSTNSDTLKAISRGADSEKLLGNIKKMAAVEGVAVYADLIAGLPLESYDVFKKSFNDVYSLGTQKIHLGFLKVLKGSDIWLNAKKHGIKYSAHAPYKVLQTNDISYGELRALEAIEHMLELYKNSDNFANSESFATGLFEAPFEFYEAFANYAKERGFFGRTQGIVKQYDFLYGFMCKQKPESIEELKDAMLLDWALMEKPRRYPACIAQSHSQKQRKYIREFYKDVSNLKEYLPEYSEFSPQSISKICHIEFFNKGKKAVLFDYKKKKSKRWTAISSKDGTNSL